MVENNGIEIKIEIEIEIEVAFADSAVQHLISCIVPQHTTLAQAIKLSGILNACSQIDLAKQEVGVFSHKRRLTDQVKPGDRIEIYRPLLIDPKEARRQKARKNINQKKGNAP